MNLIIGKYVEEKSKVGNDSERDTNGVSILSGTI
jgi:hypothetical protein